jgi:peptidoglycan/xylan/chitin deacetylase (PgdA/CDA1 family)
LADRVVLSVDVEQDVPPYLSSWRGVEEGLPRLLDLLDELGVGATFFVTGECCRLFPSTVREIAERHEVGCHGYRHERFDRLPADEQFRRIKVATEIIERTTGERPKGFRSPNFRCNTSTYEALSRLGYVYDSSLAVYRRGPRPESYGIVEVENTWPSSFLRLPVAISRPLMAASLHIFDPLVLDFHPWELVGMRGVRWDCGFATGKVAEERLRRLLEYLLGRGVKLVTMMEVVKQGV